MAGSGALASALTYVDISDYFGSIQVKGTATVQGALNYGADNGRWNLDFSDGQHAHLLATSYNSGGTGGYTLSTVDFTDPMTPVRRNSTRSVLVRHLPPQVRQGVVGSAPLPLQREHARSIASGNSAC